ncbi:MAG: hypothetical protein FJ091_15470 [Deltaproteobacteria bacterium]|nr:hypothetical protein [Deltaproteobacteria bacterium]
MPEFAMPPVSTFLEQSFLMLVAAVAALFVVTQARLGHRMRGVVVVALWLGVAGALARSGVLAELSRMPPPFALMVLGYAAATIALAFSPLGTQLVERAPLAWLVGYQAFRIPVEIILHESYEEGLIPVQMTWSGMNFDVVTGVSALVVAALAARGRAPRALVAAWNVLGCALLATIVTVAFLSAPTPLRVFMNEPANTIVTTFPYVWLPAFLVQAALFGHVLVFRWLARARS